MSSSSRFIFSTSRINCSRFLRSFSCCRLSDLESGRFFIYSLFNPRFFNSSIQVRPSVCGGAVVDLVVGVGSGLGLGLVAVVFAWLCGLGLNVHTLLLSWLLAVLLVLFAGFGLLVGVGVVVVVGRLLGAGVVVVVE